MRTRDASLDLVVFSLFPMKTVLSVILCDIFSRRSAHTVRYT